MMPRTLNHKLLVVSFLMGCCLIGAVTAAVSGLLELRASAENLVQDTEQTDLVRDFDVAVAQAVGKVGLFTSTGDLQHWDEAQENLQSARTILTALAQPDEPSQNAELSAVSVDLLNQRDDVLSMVQQRIDNVARTKAQHDQAAIDLALDRLYAYEQELEPSKSLLTLRASGMCCWPSKLLHAMFKGPPMVQRPILAS